MLRRRFPGSTSSARLSSGSPYPKNSVLGALATRESTSSGVSDPECVCVEPVIGTEHKERVSALSIAGESEGKRRRVERTMETSPADENTYSCCCFAESPCVASRLRAQRLKSSPGVRRRLDFGADEDVADQSESPWSSEERKVSALWNFNFQDEKPLPGPWTWESLISSGKGETGLTPNTSAEKQTSIKDLFRVSKTRSGGNSKRPPPGDPFLRPLPPMRTTEATSA